MVESPSGHPEGIPTGGHPPGVIPMGGKPEGHVMAIIPTIPPFDGGGRLRARAINPLSHPRSVFHGRWVLHITY